MRISLFFPPPSEVTQPYLALPMLTAYLRAHGFDNVEQRDLGIGAFDRMASQGYLSTALAKVESDLSRLEHKACLGPQEILHYDALFRAHAVGQTLPDEIEGSKQFFRTEAGGDDIEAYRRHADRVHAALRVISAAHFPTEWNAHLFGMMRSRRLPGPKLLEMARSSRDNPFVQYFQEQVSGILARAPQLVGISVAFSNQMIPGLTLAATLRSAGYDGFIVFGGAFISHCSSKLPATPELFDVVDGFISFSGEIPLLRLAEALRDGKPLGDVPGLTYRTADGLVVSSAAAPPPPLTDLPAPDFTGFDLGLYLSPRPILPLLTSRGCYFDRCTFCSHTWSYAGGYETRTADSVLRNVQIQMERHGARDFYFVDECLAPGSVRRISERLIQAHLDVRWMADVRYEKGFTRELLELAHRSGCRLLAFGLESANPRVLQLMKKGTDTQTSQRILDDCHDVGIASNVMFFIGFPSETEEEAQQTLDFIFLNRHKIDMVSLGTFQLSRNARMADIGKQVGLVFRQELPDFELSDFHRYQVASGMSEWEASKLEEVFLRRLQHEGYDYPLLSRTHALLVNRGSYGFRNPATSSKPLAEGRLLLARRFQVLHQRYRVCDIRNAAAGIREHLRDAALQALRDADEALQNCSIQVEAHPSTALVGSDMDDWAVEVSSADLDCLPSILNSRSLSRLSSGAGGVERLFRAFRLERLGVLQWAPLEERARVP